MGPALDRRLFEAVIAPGSSLVGSTLKEEGFRGRFGGAVIAIHRADERMGGKLGDVRLRTGDVLVVLAGPAFRPRALDRRDFLVVSATRGGAAADLRRRPRWVGPRHRRP